MAWYADQGLSTPSSFWFNLTHKVVLFEKGRSFTGEEAAELHVHGGRATISAILECLGSTSRPIGKLIAVNRESSALVVTYGLQTYRVLDLLILASSRSVHF